MEQQLTEQLEEDGLLFACLLDRNGGAELANWSAVEGWSEKHRPLWVHLDRDSPRVQTWLIEKSGLTQPTIDALLAEETRPRVFRGKAGTVAILRGVNTNPEADPEDMVAIRIWCDGNRVISVRHRKLMTPRDILAQLMELEEGPRSASELFERLIARLTERMAGTVASFDEKLDTIEETLESLSPTAARKELSEMRQDIVVLRRYMSPQREALNSLLAEPPRWMEESSRINLRETSDKLLRYIEELDAARERGLVIKDDIANQMAESTNQTLYVLSIISAIFLPLGFITGLLGINVGGMPGTENVNAFWIASAVMLLIVIVELWIFRKLKWL